MLDLNKLCLMLDYIFANKEWIFSGVGVSVLSVTFFFLHRFRSAHSPALQPAIAVDTPTTVKTAETVSKQMFYVSDITRIKNGEYFILPKLGPHADSSVRITLKEIENSTKSKPRARLQVDVGGSIVVCGSSVEKITTNEFLFPAREGCAGVEEDYSAFQFFTTYPTAFIFFRVFVSHINAHAGEIEINFVQVRSVWK